MNDMVVSGIQVLDFENQRRGWATDWKKREDSMRGSRTCLIYLLPDAPRDARKFLEHPS